ncbi:MAG TPA: hypothetical protein VE818_04745, partial [Nitrososphaeraceae archaeon]|nr:hypothetical protein [Nitrososphaeraceae archaeon]
WQFLLQLLNQKWIKPQRAELDKQITTATFHLFYCRYMIKIRYILCVPNKNGFYVIALIA